MWDNKGRYTLFCDLTWLDLTRHYRLYPLWSTIKSHITVTKSVTGWLVLNYICEWLFVTFLESMLLLNSYMITFLFLLLTHFWMNCFNVFGELNEIVTTSSYSSTIYTSYDDNLELEFYMRYIGNDCNINNIKMGQILCCGSDCWPMFCIITIFGVLNEIIDVF